VSDKSALEETLVWQLKVSGAPPFERGYIFARPRKFHLDVAWPTLKLGVEVQGGVWLAKGGHNTGTGLINGYEKLNLACEFSWFVLQYDSSAIRNGTAVLQILRILTALEGEK
jgi:hypothetical protein